jgi:phospholipid/cholesterol/gamma-HCH transport system permease protein
MSSIASSAHGSATGGGGPVAADLRIDTADAALRCVGEWTAFSAAPVERRLRRLHLPRGSQWHLDTAGIVRLDTAGALLLRGTLERLRREGAQVSLESLSAAHRALLELVERAQARDRTPPSAPPGRIERIGRAAVAAAYEFASFLSFVGEFAVQTLPVLLRPWRLRGRQVVAEIYKAGVRGLPIIGLLAFLMGVVIAYQGGIPLEQYGANIFIVELVSITMLREMAPLLTAVVVAGRTGSSYTAEIGTMKITEEVDALRALGLNHYEILALPKLLALLIALPLLTVFADILGIAGGMIIADLLFGVDYQTFLARMPEQLATSHFWVGVGKAPVFAAIVALVGCFHGLRVQGSAEAVGHATTVSVVQGIFLVIVADALFSIIFSMLDL